MRKIPSLKPVLAAIALVTVGAARAAQAAEWSDTAISWRYGTSFREPVNSQDIKKNIFALTHASGYRYGSNFFNVDGLISDSKDPSSPAVNSGGATEVYIVYRHTLDFGRVSGKDLKWGIARGFGGTVGFDWNTKNDAGYNSRKRMLVAGPTVMVDVPGFLNVSLLELWESNAPCNEFAGTCVSRYRYKTHPMLTAAWGIPIGDSAFSFEGFVNFIASKGRDEFGGQTRAETNFDGQVMLDVGKVAGGPKGTFKVGFEYQYWKNKFGNNNANPFFLGGATAKTPMLRAEYHF